MKVCIIDGSNAYRHMFMNMGFQIADRIPDADLICFTGGEDVDPRYYRAGKHQFTFSNIGRDDIEAAKFKQALNLRKPMVGICRGGQFLNVMCGGAMYQHVSNHGRAHHITDVATGEIVYASSTHHQMMKPTEDGLLVAFSTNNGLREWFEGEVFKSDISETDIEVVYYKDQNCLCFQPHPEFGTAEFIGLRDYFKSLLNRYLITDRVLA